MSTAMEIGPSPNEGAFLSSDREADISYIRGGAELPFDNDFLWHSLAKEQEDREENPVASVYRRSDELEMYNENGLKIVHRFVTMENGTVYPVLSSRLSDPIPEGLQGLYHAEGVGWTTRPGDPNAENGEDKSGLYGERQKLLGRLGVEATTIGIPQNPGYIIKYDQYVDDVESILLREAIEYGRDPRAALLSGISQSSMLATGLIVRGKEAHNRETLAAHLDVLCLPRGVSLKNPIDTAGQLFETIMKMRHEMRTAMRLAKMTEARRKVLIPTADITPSALYTQPQMVPSLLSGKTGKYAKQLPNTINIYTRHGRKDALGRPDVWESDEFLGKKESVVVDVHKDGSHAGVVEELIQTNWGDFMTAEVELLRENPRIRANIATASANLLAETREHYPQYAKPLPDHPTPRAA